MIAEQNYGAHSAQVEMRLSVNGASIGITRRGHDFVLVETPAEYPPCEAAILLKVDESESRWNVRLPDGISKNSKRVALSLWKEFLSQRLSTLKDQRSLVVSRVTRLTSHLLLLRHAKELPYGRTDSIS